MQQALGTKDSVMTIHLVACRLLRKRFIDAKQVRRGTGQLQLHLLMNACSSIDWIMCTIMEQGLHAKPLG